MATAKTKHPPLKKSVKPAPRRISPLSSSFVRTSTPPAPSSWYYEETLAKSSNTEMVNPASMASPEPPPLGESHCSPWTARLMSLLVFLFPFITFPWTFSAHEFPKQLFLTLGVVLGLFLIFFRWRQNAALPRHLILPLGLSVFIVALVSALRSGMIDQSLFGGSGAESLSVLGMLLLGLWIIITYNLRAHTRLLIHALIASGSLLALITLLSLVGLPLYRFFLVQGLNPAGTTTVAGVISAVTLILIAGQLLKRSVIREKILLALTLLPPLILLFGTGLRVPFIVAATGLAILTLSVFRQGYSWRAPQTLLIFSGTLLALIFAIYPFAHFLATPLEVSPAHKETWSIVRQVLQESPALGSGPASFASDYLRFRSLPILQTPFWNVAFDWGSSALLTRLATLGIVGTTLLILAALSIIVPLAYKLFKKAALQEQYTLLASGLALLVAAGLAPTPLALRFFLDTLLGLILGAYATPLLLNKHGLLKIPRAVLAIIFALTLVAAQTLRASAEIIAARAVTSPQADPAVVAQRLNRATRLNPVSDTYRRLLSGAYRAQLQKTLTDPKIMKAPAGGLQTLRENVEHTLKQARRAIELAPNNVDNWVILGNLALDIAPFTSNAPTTAMEAFSRAQTLSPADPTILVNLGIAKTLAARADAENTATLIFSAEELLRKATQIRPNFPFAHLELARFYAQNNKPDEALAAYRSVKQLVQNNPALHYEIGLLLIQVKQNEEAKAELAKAVSLNPDFSDARWFLAQAYEETGEVAKAIEQIKKVVELNPYNEQAKTRLEALQKKAE